MTKEQYLEQLTEATTDLLITTGEQLYMALRDQNYELAAKMRDKNTEIIEQAAKAFFKQEPKLSIEYYSNHFNGQVIYIQNSLCEEYGEVI
jgi:uncharacterized membrane protein YcaP (DUF421 family)